MSPHEGRVVHLSTVHHSRDNRVYNKEARGLTEAGFDLTLVITADSDAEHPVRVRALPRVSGRRARLTTSQRNAWRVLTELRPDVLHIHDPELVMLALQWRRHHGTRIIFDAHEDLVKQIDTKPYLSARARPVVRGVARRLVSLANTFDAVVAATESIAANFSNPRTVVVRNYPWLADFSAADAATVPGRVIYAGDLSEERKLSFMCDAVTAARKLVPDAHLSLAGRLLPGADAIVAAQPPGVVDHVGLLPPADLPEFLARGQLGLVFLEPLPNYLESLPTKLFEYMGAGVPFIASDFPFWQNEFGCYDAGCFIPSDDAERAGQQIAELLQRPDECRRLGDNGRRAVREHLNFDSQLPALIDVTSELLANRR